MSRRPTIHRLVVALAILLSPAAASQSARAGEPSPQYRAELKRTIELRKQRRRGMSVQPIGVIVSYPMPPALIIRHTPEVHDEINDLLWLLRH